MQSHTHAHVYRAQDMNRIIAQFGQKPPEEVKQKIRETLVREQGRIAGLEQLRERQQERTRGRGR